ncbi:hypothetical protein BYT27DRAFT_7196093, partial [Phlegmacium glaucopus]
CHREKESNYINVLKFLQLRPAFKPRSMSGIQMHFDDFQASHIQLADRVYLTVTTIPTLAQIRRFELSLGTKGSLCKFPLC